jgi:2-hydroxychromene-2-carboxylate isomerase
VIQPDIAAQTGEAIVLAPSGLGVFPDTPDTARTGNIAPVPKLGQFGRRYVLMKTRRKITRDGGASILVVDG